MTSILKVNGIEYYNASQNLCKINNHKIPYELIHGCYVDRNLFRSIIGKLFLIKSNEPDILLGNLYLEFITFLLKICKFKNDKSLVFIEYN